MEPTFHHGEAVPVDIPAGRFRFGDVLVLPHPTGPFFHRVVGRRKGLLRTKGDDRGHFDGWLTAPEQVIGRAVQRFRGENLLAGIWSAFCGHLYRVAWRLDRGAGGFAGSEYRLDVEELNRAGFRILALLFSSRN